jgi:hypothetical protein
VSGLRELIGEQAPDCPAATAFRSKPKRRVNLGVLVLEKEERHIQEEQNVRRAQIFTAASEHDDPNVGPD